MLSSNDQLDCRMTRRDMESHLGRYWMYADTRINLIPLDDNEPRLGGRVQATQTSFDVQTFTLSNKHYHGVYGEDFLAYGEFSEDVDPAQDATLLKLFEEGADEVVDRHHFKFEDQQVTYSRTLNGEVKDTEVEHEIEPTALTTSITNSWSESLFYGIGNARV